MAFSAENEHVLPQRVLESSRVPGPSENTTLRKVNRQSRMVAIQRSHFASTDDEEVAFSEAEISFLDAGKPIDVCVVNLSRIATHMTSVVAQEKWREVEMILRDILNTPIKPGCLAAIAESKLGRIIAHVFMSQPTHENFFSVRLACVVVGMWEAALEHATEQNRRTETDSKRRRV